MNRFALTAPIVVLAAAWLGSEVTRAIHRPDWADDRTEILFVGSSRMRDGIRVGEREGTPVASKMVFPCLDLFTAVRAVRAHRSRFPELSDVVFEVSDFALLADVVATDRTSIPDLCAALDIDSAQLPDHGSARRAAELLLETLSGDGLVTNHGSRRVNLDLGSSEETERMARERRERNRRLARTRLENTPRQFAEARIRYAGGLFRDSDYARRAVETLLAVVDELRADGVRVWCLVPPVTESYRAARPDAWNAIVAESVEAIRRHPSMRGRVIDLSSGRGFESMDFFDVDHLDDPGAEKMTERVLAAITAEDATGLAAPR